MTDNKEWYEEIDDNSGWQIKYEVKEWLFQGESEFQKIDIFDNAYFGVILFLNGDVQICERDADTYNAAMVPGLFDNKKDEQTKSILILGGGDGGTLRGVLEYNPKQVVMVDIDGPVVKAAKKYMKPICGDAFEDPRAEIVIGDANKYLEEGKKFDGIMYDLTGDPEEILGMETEPFLKEIFGKIANSLNPGGRVTMQCAVSDNKERLEIIKKVLPEYFKNIKFEDVFLSAFCEHWTFASAELK